MANKKLIRFYKGIVLQQIHSKLTKDGTTISIEQTDSLLKDFADIDLSTIKMANEQLQELIVWSFQFADQIGLTLDYPPDELDGMIDLNI